MLLPGKVKTSPTDHVPVDQPQFMRFNGKTWERRIRSPDPGG